MTEQQLDVRGLIKSDLKRIVSMLTQLLVFALFVPLCLGEKNPSPTSAKLRACALAV